MTLLRIIESTLPVSIGDALDLHAANRRAAGWTVDDVFTSRASKDDPEQVGRLAMQIQEWASGKERPHVFIIGDIPVPRSGIYQNPDGHETTAGAYPCPAYWATVDESLWTDELATNPSTRPQYRNTKWDGIYDQDRLPASANVAIGVLNLKSGANAAWGFDSSRTDWVGDAYLRYFTNLNQWHRGAFFPKTVFGHARMNSANPSESWVGQTDRNQTVWSRSITPRPVDDDGPFGAFMDLKGLPNNGTFWTARTKPLAAFYLSYESYQTAFPASRLLNPLMSGSACTAPLGPMWSMAGWQTKTVGELWQQSAIKGASPALALYGDPTFRIPQIPLERD